jgi:hypothetical protein
MIRKMARPTIEASHANIVNKTIATTGKVLHRRISTPWKTAATTQKINKGLPIQRNATRLRNGGNFRIVMSPLALNSIRISPGLRGTW